MNAFASMSACCALRFAGAMLLTSLFTAPLAAQDAAFASAYGGVTEGPMSAGDQGPVSALITAEDSNELGSGWGQGQATRYGAIGSGKANASENVNFSGGGGGEWFKNTTFQFDGSGHSPSVQWKATLKYFFTWAVKGNGGFSFHTIEAGATYLTGEGYSGNTLNLVGSSGFKYYEETILLNSVEWTGVGELFTGDLPLAYSASVTTLAGPTIDGGGSGSSAAQAALSLYYIEIAPFPGDGRPRIAMNPDYTSFPPLPTGDFNDDGNVNGLDLLAWQRGLGTTSGASPDNGDANGDGAVNEHDLFYWEGMFGPAQDPVVTSVPEPASFILALLAALPMARAMAAKKRESKSATST